MTTSQCIVLTGLPASGKTTVGRQLAQELGWPMLDKDDFLESAFARAVEIGDAAWRRQLSLESNVAFEQAAKALSHVVLVSHWRPLGAPGPSGTPCDWILDHFETCVEVFCECPVTTAVDRFHERKRHRGHGDAAHTKPELTEWFTDYATQLPLQVGHLVRVGTDTKMDLRKVIASLSAALGG
ncbi:MAG: AAA family ATPase [Pseudomonadota bacterium]